MNVLTDWLSTRFPEVTPEVFYRELFPAGELCADTSERGRYNAVIVRTWRDGGVEHAERHLVTDSLEQVPAVLALDGAFPRVSDLLSPVSYAGRRPRLDRAHALYALVFDLDGIKIDEDGRPVGIEDLFYQMENLPEREALFPAPTFTVSSGTGLHLYYMLDEPISLWPEVCKRLQKFRNAFTKKCWNQFVTDLSKKPQLEGVVQSFRMVGSRTKSGDQVVRAFRTGGRVSMEQMNAKVPADARVTPDMLGARRSLEEARRLWPEWDPEWRAKAAAAPGCRWRVKRDLYDWWCRRVESGEAFEGNRYWCIFVAACYAAKCPEVTYEELEEWAFKVAPMLDKLTRRAGNEFTAEDVQAALGAYGNPMSVRLRRDKVAEKTQLPMPVNKRKYQKQADHLEEARVVRDLRQGRKGTNWWDGGNRAGAPTKRDLVQTYAREHPGAAQREIADALGISKTTVNKWLRDWRPDQGD